MEKDGRTSSAPSDKEQCALYRLYPKVAAMNTKMPCDWQKVLPEGNTGVKVEKRNLKVLKNYKVKEIRLHSCLELQNIK